VVPFYSFFLKEPELILQGEVKSLFLNEELYISKKYVIKSLFIAMG
jgi:hypothetical protein